MKEIIHFSDGSSARVTVPTCDTCFERGEMSAFNGKVYFCKRDRILAYPDRCDIYLKNIRTRIQEFLDII